MTHFAFETRPLPHALTPGADGLVRALAALGGLAYDEAAVLSGVAFRTYCLTPDDNHAYRTAISEREWSWGSLDIENYGILESLAVHMDRDLRHWSFPRPSDLAALARIELEAGRPLLIRPVGQPTTTVLLTAIDVAGKRIALEPVPDGETSRHTVDDLTRWGKTDEVPTAITVRPGVDASSERRRALLRRDVLTFAGRHARSHKELSYTEELFYASGLRAWAVAAELLEDRWRAEDAQAFDGFWRAWTAAGRSGRRAAADVFARWSEDAPAFGAAADAYAAVADAVPVFTGPIDWTDALLRGHLASALLEAQALDRDALDALNRAVENLPPLG